MKKLIILIALSLYCASVHAQNTLAGNLTVQQTVKLTGSITPSTIMADVNNYAPTGFATASTVRLSSDNLHTITGLAGGAAGRSIVLMNVGEFALTLATESTSSTAGNRFAFGTADFTLAKGSAIGLWYDGTSSRWRATSNTVVDGAAIDQVARDAAAAAQATANSKQDALANASTLAKITESAGLPLWDGGAWPGGGGGTGTVTSVSVTTANGVSGTVANATTTPAITINLGAITPTSVAASGAVTGSNLSGTNTGDQTSVTGNAGTATALQTARTINGVSFDGTANITVPAAAGTLTGTTLASGVTGSSLTSAAGGTFGTAAFTAATSYDSAGAAASAVSNHVAASDPHGDRAFAVQRANHTGSQAATTITEDSTHRFVTDTEKSTWNAKQDAITGAATTITAADLTASRALVSNASGKVAVSSVTSTELGYVSGVTSGIQSQITSITPAEFYAASMTVDIGTLSSGTVADLQAIGGTDVVVQEALTTGIQVQLDSTTVARLSTFSFYGRYNGGGNHLIEVEFWNWNASAWEQVGQFGTTTAKQFYSFALNNSAAYVSGTNSRMRFRHVGTGNPAHQLILDKVAFVYGAPAGTGAVTASSVSFTPAGNLSALNVQAAIEELDNEKQPLDSDLTSIAALTTTSFGRSLLTQADAAATRTTIGAGTSSFDGAYASLSGIPSTFTPAAHNQAWSTITSTPTTLAGYGITNAQSLDTDLTALAGLSTTGLVARTGAGTAATRTITGTTDQVTVTNGDGVSGNPTLALPQSIATTSTPQFAGLNLMGTQTIDTGTGSLPPMLSNTSFRMACADTQGVRFEGVGFASKGVTFSGRSAEGTRASPSATSSSDMLFLTAHGYDGTGWVAAAKGSYRIGPNGTWSGTNNGTYHAWVGVPNGSTTSADWMDLRDGALAIGGTASAANKLFVNSLDASRVMFAGTTKGIRFTHNSTGSAIEGVDNTGSASYQPLHVGGSYVATSISGTEAMRFDSTGLGIGTTSPSALLHVERGTGTLPALRSTNTNIRISAPDAAPAAIEGVSFGQAGFSLRGVATGGTRASPTATTDTLSMFSMNAYGHDGTAFTDFQALYRIVADGLWTATNRGTAFTWVGTPKNATATVPDWMRLDTTGLSLGAYTGTRLWAYKDASANAGLGVNMSGGTGELSVFSGATTDAAGRVSFGRRRVDTSTYTEQASIDLANGNFTTSGRHVGTYGAFTGPLAAYTSASGAIYMGYSGGAYLRSVSDNAATAAPIDLQVGNGTSAVYISASRAVRFTGYGAGTLVTDSSGNITASSDAKLKNVTGTFTRGLDSILQLQPKSFTWKPESGMNPDDVNVGFIAQEVLPAISEAVGIMKTSEVEVENKDTGEKTKKSVRADAEFLTLSDRPILAALVNAVKELKAKNDELEARITKLEAKK